MGHIPGLRTAPAAPAQTRPGLLAIAPVLVPRAGRGPLFAAPVTVAAQAGPGDRLAAFLGRSRHGAHAMTWNPGRFMASTGIPALWSSE